MFISSFSKKILQHGYDAEQVPSAKQTQLQKSIRLYATTFMQDNMIGLQSLPTEEQYNAVQEKRKQEIQRRIALERQAAFEAQEKEKKQREQLESRDAPSKPTTLSTNLKSNDKQERERSGSQKLSGWIPSESSINFNDTDDPMIQQMNIIRGYVKQAKQAQKWDEVTMLELNLKELQTEYLRQQNK